MIDKDLIRIYGQLTAQRFLMEKILSWIFRNDVDPENQANEFFNKVKKMQRNADEKMDPEDSSVFELMIQVDAEFDRLRASVIKRIRLAETAEDQRHRAP